MVFSLSQKTTRINRLLRDKPVEALTASRVRRITNERGREEGRERERGREGRMDEWMDSVQEKKIHLAFAICQR